MRKLSSIINKQLTYALRKGKNLGRHVSHFKILLYVIKILEHILQLN